MPNNFGGDQYDPEYNPGFKPKRSRMLKPSPPQSLGGHLYENMQRARKELRHQAHIYANTKDRAKREAAGEELERAAIATTLSAALWGTYADAARPAGILGVEWWRKLDPESALELERMATKRKKKPR